MQKIKLISNLLVVLFTTSTYAQSKLSFPTILQSLSNKNNVVADVPNLDLLYNAKTLDQAGAIVKAMDYSQIANQKKAYLSISESANFSSLLRKKQMTLVIVPGLLGEFIKTRAFEDLFAKETSYKKTWQQMAAKSKVTDPRLNLEKYAYENILIGEEINAASIDDKNGQPLVKVIILTTELGSLESVGDNVSRAEIFNRRLEKYVQITNDKNLVLLGYSRGTPLALEMITQAETKKLSYLSRVQALVSYAGVVMGSSLADITNDQNTDSGKLYAAAKKLQTSLQTSTTEFDRIEKQAVNTAAISEFALAVAANSTLDIKAMYNSAQSADFKSTSNLILDVVTKLGLKSVVDFNGHVNRMKLFISEILTSVAQLRSENMRTWWMTHTLPKNVKYYSISAVMVDPNHSELEKQIYDAKVGYNATLDDAGLLKNMNDYVKATGYRLNDSQVAIHQSQFLPGVIAGLNPNNKDLKIQSLGILQTHHWGASLRTVNTMNDGTMNPFPRESVLLGLAVYLNQ